MDYKGYKIVYTYPEAVDAIRNGEYPVLWETSEPFGNEALFEKFRKDQWEGYNRLFGIGKDGMPKRILHGVNDEGNDVINQDVQPIYNWETGQGSKRQMLRSDVMSGIYDLSGYPYETFIRDMLQKIGWNLSGEQNSR